MSIKERDVVLVSTNEDNDTIIDMPVTRENCVEGLGRIRGTAYSVGDVALCAGSQSLQLICTASGTTSLNELDISANTEGDTITDGTVSWKVVKRTLLICNSAAAHNAIFCGRYLGDHVTDEQWAAIKAGTFEGLYIGDYWTINGVDYVIAAFDYYLNCGDAKVTAHHITLVPRKNLYNHVMNDTNVVTGAYVGSKMYASGLNTAKTTISSAFGSAHILSIRQTFQNAVKENYESGSTWYDASVFLMSEINVYGGNVWKNIVAGTSWSNNYQIDNSQYPIFAFDKTMIHTGETYWLRDVVYSGYFAIVANTGNASNDQSANDANGVRPAFNIYQS